MSRPTIFAILASVSACEEKSKLDTEALMDPETCQECHPKHYREWQGSMHAYAAEDPVFLAMNERGQRETNGALGDFCIRCHAPVAVATGETEDGLNIQELPQKMRGVTCYACHNVTDVTGTHNNPVVLGLDQTMRGGITDPVVNPAHNSEYSPFLDSLQLESGDMCGSCHDIVTENGVHLEQTYKEWKDSFFSDRDEFSGQKAVYAVTCNGQGCHVPTEEDVVADFDGVSLRQRHKHEMAAVDVQLTPWPDAETAVGLIAEQRAQIDINRAGVTCASLCVNPIPDAPEESEIVVWLHNEAAGHNWPSGATQDRRIWVELSAEAGGEVVFQSGHVEPGQPVAYVAEEDPDMLVLRGWLYGEDGEEVHMFWDAHSKVDKVLTIPEIPGARYDAETWQSTSFRAPSAALDKITMRLKLRPMGLEVLQDLVDSGDLDQSVVGMIQTFDIPPAALDWDPETAEESPGGGLCVSSQPLCSCIFAETC